MRMRIQPMHFFLWGFILIALFIGAGVYWFFTREFKGQAAETTNIAHTEALTATGLGLQGYWTLDGNDTKWSDSATEIKDTSGNSRHGDAQGSLAATSVTPGRVGQSLLFNGTSDLISLGNVYNGIKTVSFWAKPNSTAQPFIDLNGTATINMTSGTVAASNFTSPTIYIDGSATSTFPDTNWHHVTITTNTGINASATNIGKISSSYFGGILDDIRFYSTALSSTQVADLYQGSGAKETNNASHRDALTSGLVGYWTFDGRDINWGDTGAEIKDISESSNHGDAVGLTKASVLPGKLGQALSFDGVDDEVIIGSSLGTLSTGFSVAFWMRSSEVSGNSYLVQWNQFDSGCRTDYAPTGSIVCDLNWNGDGSIHTNYALTDGVWHYVVYASGAGGQTLFIDGVVFDSTSTPHVAIAPPSIQIGGDYFGSGDKYYGGTLDDVRIYNRMLSENEVLHLYLLGK